jgi:glutathione S-transferase
MLRIWGRTSSSNVQKVLWAAAELGVAYERVDAGGQFGIVDTPEYRAMNPMGRVPTIQEDGFVLWESNAILRYLAQAHGGGSEIVPRDLREWALCHQWIDWQVSALMPTFPQVMRQFRAPEVERDQALIDRNVETLEAMWAILDSRLGRGDYLLGDRFTIADIPAGVWLARRHRLELARRDLPALDAWFARLKERPAYHEHVMQASLSW